MIVLIGRPTATAGDERVRAGGLAGVLGTAAVQAGSSVQLVARIADDPGGDALVAAVAAAGIGHVATLRQPPTAAPPALDAADLELALRYLAEMAVIVLTDHTDDPAVRAVAADAAAWGRAPLIVILPHGAPVPDDLPADATVLDGPRADPDGAFARWVGSYAAALDQGSDARSAFADTIAASGGWTPSG